MALPGSFALSRYTERPEPIIRYSREEVKERAVDKTHPRITGVERGERGGTASPLRSAYYEEDANQVVSSVGAGSY
ncbi:chlorohydrolase family protein [Aspergillus luchuensis]|uniref:Chlorohydrolase family protein n=1 Tax=Aspergillus kawachii TaxID=1069201 RepID=A0A146FZ07_ASPKA|nr:chlorohydrolase family protein [Aspergillus luchuensis]